VPDNFEEDSVDVEARGRKEVRAILKVLHTHLVNLRDDYAKESQKSGDRSGTCSPGGGGSTDTHVLAQAIDAQGVEEVMRRAAALLYEPSIWGGLIEECGSTANRLAPLAKQLPLLLRSTLLEAKSTYKEVLVSATSQVDSHVSLSVDAMMVGVGPPARGLGDILLAPRIESEGDPQSPRIQATPDTTFADLTISPLQYIIIYTSLYSLIYSANITKQNETLTFLVLLIINSNSKKIFWESAPYNHSKQQ
jgi:hypothetical protein